MAKLILLSIVIVSVVVPMLLATRRSPVRMLRNAQVAALLAVVVWAYMCISWYPQLVPVD